MSSSSKRPVVGAVSLLLCASGLVLAQDAPTHGFVGAPDGSAVLVLPAGHAGTNQATDALALYESDRGNRALDCADGRSASPDPISVTCRFAHSRTIAIRAAAGPVELHALASSFRDDRDGLDVRTEDVVIVDAQGRPAHTLAQWVEERGEAATHLLRRRYRVVDVDRSGPEELCIETSTESGPGRSALAGARSFRPSRRSVGVDAYVWAGNHLARAEALDGACPRSGYQLFVATPAPAGADGIAARRDAR